jgi:Flp pilus assembly protein TadD
MKRAFRLIAPVALVIALGLPTPSAAQTSQVRGIVVDEAGQPLPDITVEFQYVGEGPKKTYTVKTNKKGGYVRVGLPAGSYKIFFKKEGYARYGVDTYLSLGGLSEICANATRPGEPCKDIVLKKEQVTAAIPASGTGSASGAGSEGPTATPEEAAKLGAAYKQAIEAIKASQWDVAEAALKEVLVKTPDQPTVLFNLGHVYRQKGDFDGAEAQFKRAMKLDPTKPEPYIALAALYQERGRGPEAVDLLAKAAPAFEQDVKFQTALGATAMNTGREGEAEEAFARALALDPSNVEIHFHLASLALNRGEIDDAVGHLDKYIDSAPADAPNLEVAKSLRAALRAKARKVS